MLFTTVHTYTDYSLSLAHYISTLYEMLSYSLKYVLVATGPNALVVVLVE